MLPKRTNIAINTIWVLILSLSVWLWSGLRIVYIPFFSVAALILLLSILWLEYQTTRTRPPSQISFNIDPLLPIGILFMLYLGIQAWNAGRPAYFDVGELTWLYPPPPRPHLPSAYNAGEAFRFMQWFWVAWILALTIRFLQRHGNPDYTRIGIIAVLINASLLVCMGLFTFFIIPGKMFGLEPVTHRFFASFPYVNHAAAYFVMMAALAGGFLLHQVCKRQNKAKTTRHQILLFMILTFLCVIGANFAFSRAGIILAWGLIATGALYGLFKCWYLLKPAAKVNMTAATMATIAILYFFVSGFGSDHIRQRFTIRTPPTRQMIPQLAKVNLDLTVRPRLWQGGWDVFKSHWLYGTGGWGFRYAFAMHVPPEEWDHLVRRSGRANVHHDPIQFLSELGIVGSSILLAGIAILLWPLRSRHSWHSPIVCMTAMGLLLVYIFSLIDLPFRAPAILWAWTTLLAWLPSIHSTRKSKHTHSHNPEKMDTKWTQITPS